MPILVGQTEPCEAEKVAREDAETSESTRPHYPEGAKPCDTEVGDGGDSTSDGSSVESGGRKRSDAHHSGSDVCAGEEGMAPSLAEFDVLRFRNSFLKAVEELRMRRLIDVENEERIKDLVARTHELEEKLREEQSRYAAVIEEHSQEEQEMRKQCDEQMKQMEDEKAKYGLSIEGKERELKALKDEIRALHLAKYNLEKKVQEQDRQLQLQMSSRDSHLSQMSQLEQKCSTAFKQAAEATEQMEKIEANVKQAVELNRKLQCMNSHQQCTIEACRGELETCRQELLEAKVQLAGQQGTMGGGEDHGRVKTSEQELKMQVELNHQLQVQLLGLREEHQAILQQLKEAHNLIQRHVETSAKLSASKDEMEKEMANLTEKRRELGEQLSTSMEQCQSMKVKYNTDTKEWEEKCADTEQRLKTLQADYSALQASHDKLEEAKVAAEKQLKSKTCDGKEAQQTLEEVEQLRDELHKLKERSLKEGQEWSEKAEKLQTALQQSEQLLTEKEKLLEMKEKQCCELEAKYKKELQGRAVFNSVNPPATLADCVQDSGTDHPSCLSHIQRPEVPPEENKCQTTSTVNEQVADKLSILESPVSHMLSPDVICSSQDFTKHSSPEQITNTEEPMEVAVHASKNLSPRIHLEKINLPLAKYHEGKEGTASKDPTAHQNESASPGCQNDGTVQLAAQSESLGVAPNLTENNVKATLKREAEETFRDSEPRQLPQKKPRISVISGTDPTPLVSNELSAAECSQASESNQEPQKGRTQNSDSASQQVGGSHNSLPPQLKSSLLAPTGHNKDDSKSSSDSPSCGNQSTRHSQPNLMIAEQCLGKDASLSVKVPSSWKLENPKPKNLCTVTNPPRAYHQVLHSEADKQLKSSLKNRTKTLSELTASLAVLSPVTQKESFKDHSAESSDQDDENSTQLSLALPLASSNTLNNSTCVPQASKSDGCQETLKEDSTVSHDTGSESANTPNKDNSLLVVFSEDDEEEDEAKSHLLSSQMNRQIDRVQTFLKIDRLRRPKSIK